ncbi:MAG TPA: hypothetical protein VMS31_19395, partial [Pyrinomonadaceae bacterium]|nr:hypothetical protein [Pyrinomonadaceae bacterium]
MTASLMVTIAWGSLAQGPSSNKKAYERTGLEVTLSGTATFSGPPPKAQKIDMSADPECYVDNLDPETESVVVNNEKLANVVVYASSNFILDNYSFEPSSATVVMEHKGCRYVPHVLAIQTGQHLSINNSDQTTHNTHPTPKINQEWNQSQPVGGRPLAKAFSRTEVSIPFKDNLHPWEKAYVGVFTHPFFAVSDANGNFKIEGLPPG